MRDDLASVTDFIKNVNKLPAIKTGLEITLDDGKVIRLSSSLKRLYAMHRRGSELSCCMCGCHGTHLQRFTEKGMLPGGGKVGEVDNWRIMCYASNGKQGFLNVDHYLPRWAGGTFAFENIRITCNHCNADVKGGEIPSDVKPLLTPDTICKTLKSLILNTYQKARKIKEKAEIIINSLRKKLRVSTKDQGITIDLVKELLSQIMVSVGLKPAPLLESKALNVF